jgi:hypothetical protein
VVALGLAAWAIGDRATRIRVVFESGYGLKPGDALRYRGVEVGRVESIEMLAQSDRFEVVIALDHTASQLAREGSQFWIARPQLSLSRISGLETVVGASYVGVLPGPAESAPALSFEGLESPPILTEASGLEISIRFSQGHGLTPGDPLKYRGIVVGEVVEVSLGDDLASVTAKVRVAESARGMARAGSQFWIARPEIGISGVRGLDTVVGGRYMAVLPGPEGAMPTSAFEGLERPPALDERTEGGLEVLLEGTDRGGLEPGSPVLYRGIAVGRVTSVGLSSDAVRVEAGVYVEPQYRLLIRDNTRFWATSGVGLNLGWSGLQLDVESLSTLASGGVALATPEPPGRTVETGHRFSLSAEPEAEWKTWQPSLPTGSSLLPGQLTIPRPLRVSQTWQEEGLLGTVRDRQRDGWSLFLDSGRLLGPASLLTATDAAIPGSVKLSLEGKQWVLQAGAAGGPATLATYRLEPVDPVLAGGAWPVARCRVPNSPEDALVISDGRTSERALAASRMTVKENHWEVDPSLPFSEQWHGAAVVSRRDGALIGLLCCPSPPAIVAPLTDDLLRK